MIISHKYRFIFIKTEKTAGTSVEIALSKYLGENDVITPLSPEDEHSRKQKGYRGAQNYFAPFARYTMGDWARIFLKKNRVAFYNHVSAEFVRRWIGKQTWESYFKFCFERNPWDKAVSFYFWRNPTEPRPTISEFIQRGGANSILGFDLYASKGQLLVDRVGKYEDLQEEMEAVASIVGLPETPHLPHAKSKTRSTRGYRAVLTEADRLKIGQVFAREIAYFGYQW
jgi:hypothetical protein